MMELLSSQEAQGYEDRILKLVDVFENYNFEFISEI